MKRIVLLVTLLPCAAALAQATPFVAGVSETGDFRAEVAGWVDVPSTVRTLTIPSGTAVFNWSATVKGDPPNVSAAFRPVIGSTIGPDIVFQAGAASVTVSSTWTIDVVAESVDIRLQVNAMQGGSVVINRDGGPVVWSLIIFPDAKTCVSDADCDDRNDCTIDGCGGTGLCEQTDKDDGIVCEDGFFCTINDSCLGGVCTSGPVNPLCVGAPGEDGSPGQPGSQGPSGSAGPAGVSCWDLDGDGTGNPEEDINEDGDFNAMDCVGEPGPPGVSCWDLNGNGIGDLDEDANGDGNFDALDCQGATGRPCEEDSEYQDGLFCNGTEQCDDDTCTPGTPPCDRNTEVCLEDSDECVPEETAGQQIPNGGLCGATGPAIILTFFGLAGLRFVGRRRASSLRQA